MDLTTAQKRTVIAAYLGWALDAFDFFLLTFLIKDIAKKFGVTIPHVAYALFLTLAMRFVGAFIFGRIGDKFGRKPALMIDILSYSVLGAAAAFSPNLTVFLILRALFGIAMGGEWGLGIRWRWNRSRRTRAAPSRGCCRPAIPAASCSPRSSMACFMAADRRLLDRLAGDVPVQRVAGVCGAVHPLRRRGIAGLRRSAERRQARPLAVDHEHGASSSIPS